MTKAGFPRCPTYMLYKSSNICKNIKVGISLLQYTYSSCWWWQCMSMKLETTNWTQKFRTRIQKTLILVLTISWTHDMLTITTRLKIYCTKILIPRWTDLNTVGYIQECHICFHYTCLQICNKWNTHRTNTHDECMLTIQYVDWK